MAIPQGHPQRLGFGASASLVIPATTVVTPTTMIGCGWRFALKAAADRVLALLGLLILAPLLSVIALGVRLSSKGPVIYRQRRVGLAGVPFVLFKFRTMVEDSGTGNFTPAKGSAPGGIEGTDRCTAVGRWLRKISFDELPQLLNVLRGDMSLIGPRPERPEFVDLYSEEVHGYTRRHRMKSGITGWAQANGLRGQTSIARRVEFDNFYIENWSLALDLRILALTVVEILRCRDDRPTARGDSPARRAAPVPVCSQTAVQAARADRGRRLSRSAPDHNLPSAPRPGHRRGGGRYARYTPYRAGRRLAEAEVIGDRVDGQEPGRRPRVRRPFGPNENLLIAQLIAADGDRRIASGR